MMDRRYIVILMVCLIFVGFAFSGCTSDDSGGEDNTDTTDGGGSSDLTGTSTYTGTWEGTVGGEPYSGTLQLEADFDSGSVSGNFSGDAQGDIQGTISGGTIDADSEGEAAFGAVVWSGDFSSDGASIDGNWEFKQGAEYGSGTWQATEE